MGEQDDSTANKKDLANAPGSEHAAVGASKPSTAAGSDGDA